MEIVHLVGFEGTTGLKNACGVCEILKGDFRGAANTGLSK
jgi:hypothetical protein